MRNAHSRCLMTIAMSLLFATRGFCDGTQPGGVTSPAVRLPEVTVTGEQPLNENQPIGPNQQPEWTAYRRFPFTRIYVLPPWHFEAESGWDATYNRSGGGPPFHLITQEFELGLPYRFQVDYEYAETINDPGFGSTGHRYDGSSFELRWALADWGKLWFNPALKAEYRLANAQADFYELSLSLGDQFAERWHWGVDFFYEQQVGDVRTTERSVSGALSYTLIDEKFSIGTEMKLKDETDNLDRHSHLVFLVGPSIQWRPTRNTHLDIVPLLGTTGPSPRIETFIFFGIDFGPGSERSEALAPASLRNK
jgi:hypothetical protein